MTAEDDAAGALRQRLRDLALNLWWTWHADAIELFRDLDPAAWRETNHNPIALLDRLSDGALGERAETTLPLLESRINFQHRRLEEYQLAERTWCGRHAAQLQALPVAYFCAEFGLHESLPLYSGGLGVLAGDHVKSASDLGLPLVGVGLFYANGYFRQQIDDAGSQREEYGVTDVRTLPLAHAAGSDGSPLMIEVQCGSGPLRALVWLAHVGRARLVLLDSDVPSNPEELRGLTATLYGGDQRTRIRQEILLGVGGLRALRALDIRPSVLHLNEGHSAFAILERTRERVQEDGLDFDEAFRRTMLQTVFTTHTPVEAGHDRFSAELVEQELGWLRDRIGVDRRRFLAVGRVNPDAENEPLVMTVLGLRGSRKRNAVSSLHGDLTRRMWNSVYPGRSEEEVPIGHITNGVHALSWIAPAVKQVYDRALGPEWPVRQADPDTWRRVDRISDTELWETHILLRRRLVEFVRRRLGSARVLDARALTIAFARRFTAYKRPTLILSDLDRLARIFGQAAEAPVQIIFAGKAHPHDEGGKALIREVVERSRDPRFTGRLVFVPDDDISVARHLVQGADVWLNTPLRPLEASGTSGQKAALNGALNLSILDGWWAEAYDGENGFAIGSTDVHADAGVQWRRDADSLYQTLEGEVLPTFFDTDRTGLPLRWIERMRRSIRMLAWRYNADRMVMDYVTQCYLPAAGSRTVGM